MATASRSGSHFTRAAETVGGGAIAVAMQDPDY
jgi:hypothetical protein